MSGICHTWLAKSVTSPQQMQLHRSEKGRSLVNPVQVTSNFTKINRIKKWCNQDLLRIKDLFLEREVSRCSLQRSLVEKEQQAFNFFGNHETEFPFFLTNLVINLCAKQITCNAFKRAVKEKIGQTARIRHKTWPDKCTCTDQPTIDTRPALLILLPLCFPRTCSSPNHLNPSFPLTLVSPLNTP